MNPISDTARPESNAHNRRVEALVSSLTPHLPPDTGEPEAFELCSAFDQAVEFAACEGKPVPAAIAEFLEEDWGPAAAMQKAALKKLVLPAAPFVPFKLPVLPSAASRLLQTSDESASVTELELIAGSDPALAAQLLSTANSALYGSRSRIHRLRDALMRLGVPAARKALMAASFSALFATKHLQELWTHSREVAASASELAASCGADAESAFVAGLLHDLGRVAFTVFPESMQNAEQRWLAAGFPLIYAESIAYGSDHAAFGADLLRSWRLPEEIVAAVAHHHRPECSDSCLHAAVYLAESADEDLWSNMRKQTALDRTGIGRRQLDSILEGQLATI
jgi:putative nucleotidyltransferase with HDIG domain